MSFLQRIMGKNSKKNKSKGRKMVPEKGLKAAASLASSSATPSQVQAVSTTPQVAAQAQAAAAAAPPTAAQPAKLKGKKARAQLVATNTQDEASQASKASAPKQKVNTEEQHKTRVEQTEREETASGSTTAVKLPFEVDGVQAKNEGIEQEYVCHENEAFQVRAEPSFDKKASDTGNELEEQIDQSEGNQKQLESKCEETPIEEKIPLDTNQTTTQASNADAQKEALSFNEEEQLTSNDDREPQVALGVPEDHIILSKEPDEQKTILQELKFTNVVLHSHVKSLQEEQKLDSIRGSLEKELQKDKDERTEEKNEQVNFAEELKNENDRIAADQKPDVYKSNCELETGSAIETHVSPCADDTSNANLKSEHGVRPNDIDEIMPNSPCQFKRAILTEVSHSTEKSNALLNVSKHNEKLDDFEVVDFIEELEQECPNLTSDKVPAESLMPEHKTNQEEHGMTEVSLIVGKVMPETLKEESLKKDTKKETTERDLNATVQQQEVSTKKVECTSSSTFLDKDLLVELGQNPTETDKANATKAIASEREKRLSIAALNEGPTRIKEPEMTATAVEIKQKYQKEKASSENVIQEQESSRVVQRKDDLQGILPTDVCLLPDDRLQEVHANISLPTDVCLQSDDQLQVLEVIISLVEGLQEPEKVSVLLSPTVTEASTTAEEKQASLDGESRYKRELEVTDAANGLHRATVSPDQIMQKQECNRHESASIDVQQHMANNVQEPGAVSVPRHQDKRIPVLGILNVPVQEEVEEEPQAADLEHAPWTPWLHAQAPINEEQLSHAADGQKLELNEHIAKDAQEPGVVNVLWLEDNKIPELSRLNVSVQEQVAQEPHAADLEQAPWTPRLPSKQSQAPISEEQLSQHAVDGQKLEVKELIDSVDEQKLEAEELNDAVDGQKLEHELNQHMAQEPRVVNAPRHQDNGIPELGMTNESVQEGVAQEPQATELEQETWTPRPHSKQGHAPIHEERLSHAVDAQKLVLEELNNTNRETVIDEGRTEVEKLLLHTDQAESTLDVQEAIALSPVEIIDEAQQTVHEELENHAENDCASLDVAERSHQTQVADMKNRSVNQTPECQETQYTQFAESLMQEQTSRTNNTPQGDQIQLEEAQISNHNNASQDDDQKLEEAQISSHVQYETQEINEGKTQEPVHTNVQQEQCEQSTMPTDKDPEDTNDHAVQRDMEQRTGGIKSHLEPVTHKSTQCTWPSGSVEDVPDKLEDNNVKFGADVQMDEFKEIETDSKQAESVNKSPLPERQMFDDSDKLGMEAGQNTTTQAAISVNEEDTSLEEEEYKMRTPTFERIDAAGEWNQESPMIENGQVPSHIVTPAQVLLDIDMQKIVLATLSVQTPLVDKMQGHEVAHVSIDSVHHEQYHELEELEESGGTQNSVIKSGSSQPETPDVTATDAESKVSKEVSAFTEQDVQDGTRNPEVTELARKQIQENHEDESEQDHADSIIQETAIIAVDCQELVVAYITQHQEDAGQDIKATFLSITEGLQNDEAQKLDETEMQQATGSFEVQSKEGTTTNIKIKLLSPKDEQELELDDLIEIGVHEEINQRQQVYQNTKQAENSEETIHRIGQCAPAESHIFHQTSTSFLAEEKQVCQDVNENKSNEQELQMAHVAADQKPTSASTELNQPLRDIEMGEEVAFEAVEKKDGIYQPDVADVQIESVSKHQQQVEKQREDEAKATQQAYYELKCGQNTSALNKDQPLAQTNQQKIELEKLQGTDREGETDAEMAVYEQRKICELKVHSKSDNSITETQCNLQITSEAEYISAQEGISAKDEQLHPDIHQLHHVIYEAKLTAVTPEQNQECSGLHATQLIDSNIQEQACNDIAEKNSNMQELQGTLLHLEEEEQDFGITNMSVQENMQKNEVQDQETKTEQGKPDFEWRQNSTPLTSEIQPSLVDDKEYQIRELDNAAAVKMADENSPSTRLGNITFEPKTDGPAPDKQASQDVERYTDDIQELKVATEAVKQNNQCNEIKRDPIALNLLSEDPASVDAVGTIKKVEAVDLFLHSTAEGWNLDARSLSTRGQGASQGIEESSRELWTEELQSEKRTALSAEQNLESSVLDTQNNEPQKAEEINAQLKSTETFSRGQEQASSILSNQSIELENAGRFSAPIGSAETIDIDNESNDTWKLAVSDVSSHSNHEGQEFSATNLSKQEWCESQGLEKSKLKEQRDKEPQSYQITIPATNQEQLLGVLDNQNNEVEQTNGKVESTIRIIRDEQKNGVHDMEVDGTCNSSLFVKESHNEERAKASVCTEELHALQSIEECKDQAQEPERTNEAGTQNNTVDECEETESSEERRSTQDPECDHNISAVSKELSSVEKENKEEMQADAQDDGDVNASKDECKGSAIELEGKPANRGGEFISRDDMSIERSKNTTEAAVCAKAQDAVVDVNKCQDKAKESKATNELAENKQECHEKEPGQDITESIIQEQGANRIEQESCTQKLEDFSQHQDEKLMTIDQTLLSTQEDMQKDEGQEHTFEQEPRIHELADEQHSTASFVEEDNPLRTRVSRKIESGALKDNVIDVDEQQDAVEKQELNRNQAEKLCESSRPAQKISHGPDTVVTKAINNAPAEAAIVAEEVHTCDQPAQETSHSSGEILIKADNEPPGEVLSRAQQEEHTSQEVLIFVEDLHENAQKLEGMNSQQLIRDPTTEQHLLTCPTDRHEVERLEGTDESVDPEMQKGKLQELQTVTDLPLRLQQEMQGCEEVHANEQEKKVQKLKINFEQAENITNSSHIEDEAIYNFDMLTNEARGNRIPLEALTSPKQQERQSFGEDRWKDEINEKEEALNEQERHEVSSDEPLTEPLLEEQVTPSLDEKRDGIQEFQITGAPLQADTKDNTLSVIAAEQINEAGKTGEINDKPEQSCDQTEKIISTVDTGSRCDTANRSSIVSPDSMYTSTQSIGDNNSKNEEDILKAEMKQENNEEETGQGAAALNHQEQTLVEVNEVTVALLDASEPSDEMRDLKGNNVKPELQCEENQTVPMNEELSSLKVGSKEDEQQLQVANLSLRITRDVPELEVSDITMQKDEEQEIHKPDARTDAITEEGGPDLECEQNLAILDEAVLSVEGDNQENEVKMLDKATMSVESKNRFVEIKNLCNPINKQNHELIYERLISSTTQEAVQTTEDNEKLGEEEQEVQLIDVPVVLDQESQEIESMHHQKPGEYEHNLTLDEMPVAFNPESGAAETEQVLELACENFILPSPQEATCSPTHDQKTKEEEQEVQLVDVLVASSPENRDIESEQKFPEKSSDPASEQFLTSKLHDAAPTSIHDYTPRENGQEVDTIEVPAALGQDKQDREFEEPHKQSHEFESAQLLTSTPQEATQVSINYQNPRDEQQQMELIDVPTVSNQETEEMDFKGTPKRQESDCEQEAPKPQHESIHAQTAKETERAIKREVELTNVTLALNQDTEQIGSVQVLELNPREQLNTYKPQEAKQALIHHQKPWEDKQEVELIDVPAALNQETPGKDSEQVFAALPSKHFPVAQKEHVVDFIDAPLEKNQESLEITIEQVIVALESEEVPASFTQECQELQAERIRPDPDEQTGELPKLSLTNKAPTELQTQDSSLVDEGPGLEDTDGAELSINASCPADNDKASLDIEQHKEKEQHSPIDSAESTVEDEKKDGVAKIALTNDQLGTTELSTDKNVQKDRSREPDDESILGEKQTGQELGCHKITPLPVHEEQPYSDGQEEDQNVEGLKVEAEHVSCTKEEVDDRATCKGLEQGPGVGESMQINEIQSFNHALVERSDLYVITSKMLHKEPAPIEEDNAPTIKAMPEISRHPDLHVLETTDVLEERDSQTATGKGAAIAEQKDTVQKPDEAIEVELQQRYAPESEEQSTLFVDEFHARVAPASPIIELQESTAINEAEGEFQILKETATAFEGQKIETSKLEEPAMATPEAPLVRHEASRDIHQKVDRLQISERTGAATKEQNDVLVELMVDELAIEPHDSLTDSAKFLAPLSSCADNQGKEVEDLAVRTIQPENTGDNSHLEILMQAGVKIPEEMLATAAEDPAPLNTLEDDNRMQVQKMTMESQQDCFKLGCAQSSAVNAMLADEQKDGVNVTKQQDVSKMIQELDVKAGDSGDTELECNQYNPIHDTEEMQPKTDGDQPLKKFDEAFDSLQQVAQSLSSGTPSSNDLQTVAP